MLCGGKGNQRCMGLVGIYSPPGGALLELRMGEENEEIAPDSVASICWRRM